MTTPAGWYPGAVKKPIAPGSNDPVIVPVLAILHVAVSTALSLFPFFNGPSKGIESHFYVRWDGTVEQYRSVFREADANFGANSYTGDGGGLVGAVSVEAQGLAGGVWRPKQLAAIKALLLWLHTEHGVPLQPVTAPRPRTLAEGGVSYHSRYTLWSNVKGKTCPGPKRIMQYVQDIRPWMKSIQDCTHCPVHCPKEV